MFCVLLDLEGGFDNVGDKYLHHTCHDGHDGSSDVLVVEVLVDLGCEPGAQSKWYIPS